MLSLLSVPLLLLPAVLGSTFHHNAIRAPHISLGVAAGKKVDMVAAAWYAGWHSEDFPLDKVSWDKYTHMTYSFAVTTSDVNTLSLDDSNKDNLPAFVSAAQDNGVKALVSVGGWTGSRFFSTAVATAENRTAFVKTITNLATQYKLDGIDFDWEYPNNQGVGCNAISDTDTANFLSFLQELRKDPVGKDLIITAATPIFPWKGADGNSVADVSKFAKVLDYIAIMNYDIWGSWSPSVGPNAPLNDTCAPAAAQQGSAVSAIAAWEKAGMPSHQIVLGVPAYGHSYKVAKSDAITGDGDSTVLASYPAFDSTQKPKGDSWDDEAGVDVCGATTGPGGNFNFWGLIDNGFLFENGTAAAGIDYRFDECSQTAYVYNPETEIMVSFDDAKAFAAKGSFIKANNLRGFALWEAGGDSNDILLDAISEAAGLTEDDC